MEGYEGRGLLGGRKKALITGGDSGIGRAVAVAFAKEGADVAIAYLSEHDDAQHTAKLVEAEGRNCARPRRPVRGGKCRQAVATTVDQLGGIDILVNNIAQQKPVESLAEVTSEEWDATFRTNVHSYFWCTQAALEHMADGSAIINTGSVNGLRGNKELLAYAATKGAVHVFTKSMAQVLVDRRIRVNCVAPGPVWTPLIPSTMPPEKVARVRRSRRRWTRPPSPTTSPRRSCSWPRSGCPAFYTGQVSRADRRRDPPGLAVRPGV